MMTVNGYEYRRHEHHEDEGRILPASAITFKVKTLRQKHFTISIFKGSRPGHGPRINSFNCISSWTHGGYGA